MVGVVVVVARGGGGVVGVVFFNLFKDGPLAQKELFCGREVFHTLTHKPQLM